MKVVSSDIVIALSVCVCVLSYFTFSFFSCSCYPKIKSFSGKKDESIKNLCIVDVTDSAEITPLLVKFAKQKVSLILANKPPTLYPGIREMLYPFLAEQ